MTTQILPGISWVPQGFLKIFLGERQQEKDAVYGVPTSPGNDINDLKSSKILSVAWAQRPAGSQCLPLGSRLIGAFCCTEGTYPHSYDHVHTLLGVRERRRLVDKVRDLCRPAGGLWKSH